mmetsp:Transcript_12921/g.20031  ORF Transcript_12921/g.20031 Transcript_12921/m.20031 type:complete len:109 (-) Transcript_12921:361-687(-)|eukprot:CAMPEP_0170511508 /NCGR_PEP_ID=MMETSP0208-20121228/66346_1 /TAXON_ID=197538 /ORGANISM="Strombidium inclinatum, Strain S3" /LENGTH=108 /DNA_ID=CAMNT_0010795057 /DNA_START=632 /DNA_END=958 /DNA_ORIENTATION=-
MVEEDEDCNNSTPDELPKLTSFDILAYVYLKEELVNTPDSVEVKYLTEKFKNLVKFVKFMDKITDYENREVHRKAPVPSLLEKSKVNALTSLHLDSGDIRNLVDTKFN